MVAESSPSTNSDIALVQSAGARAVSLWCIGHAIDLHQALKMKFYITLSYKLSWKYVSSIRQLCLNEYICACVCMRECMFHGCHAMYSCKIQREVNFKTKYKYLHICRFWLVNILSSKTIQLLPLQNFLEKISQLNPKRKQS